MCPNRDPPPCEHDDLVAEVDRLQGLNARLNATVKELHRQLAAAQTSGSKAWYGKFSYRKPPSADELSGPPVDVSVDDDNCPGCGEAIELWESERRGEAADYAEETERLRRAVSHHLRDRPMPGRNNWRGCRPSLAGTMTVGTCCAFWTVLE